MRIGRTALLVSVVMGTSMLPAASFASGESPRAAPSGAASALSVSTRRGVASFRIETSRPQCRGSRDAGGYAGTAIKPAYRQPRNATT